MIKISKRSIETERWKEVTNNLTQGLHQKNSGNTTFSTKLSYAEQARKQETPAKEKNGKKSNRFRIAMVRP